MKQFKLKDLSPLESILKLNLSSSDKNATKKKYEDLDKYNISLQEKLYNNVISSSLIDNDQVVSFKNYCRIKRKNSDFVKELTKIIKKINKYSSEIPDEEKDLLKKLTDVIKNGIGVTKKHKIAIIGGGPSGLCAGYELLNSGQDVTIFEASTRVGGRMKTIHEPFTKGLHSEGGAMRLPSNHHLVNEYIEKFNLKDELENFEQKNKLLYLSTYGKTIKYSEFEEKLKAVDKDLLTSFPKLKANEKGKTIDNLWADAIEIPNSIVEIIYDIEKDVSLSYKVLTVLFDSYSLKTYFKSFKEWSEDCVNLYDLGSPHVVLDNAFIESWKDGFLSSQTDGEKAKMRQFKSGIDTFSDAFLTEHKGVCLSNNIIYGARVTEVLYDENFKKENVKITFSNQIGSTSSDNFDIVIFAVPFTAQRLINSKPPFSTDKYSAIRNVRYVDVTKVLLQFKSRWWEEILSILDQGKEGGIVTDLPIRYSMFPNSNSAELKENKRGTIMASYSFQQDAKIMGANTLENIVKITLNNLEEIFSKLNTENISPEKKEKLTKSISKIKKDFEIGTAQIWSSDNYSGGAAFAYFSPQQKSIFYEAMNQPEWENKAYFIGEHNSFSHGWIEGALESALRTLLDIKEYLNTKEEALIQDSQSELIKKILTQTES